MSAAVRSLTWNAYIFCFLQFWNSVREHDVDLHMMCVEDQTLPKSNSISSSHLLRHIQCLETIAIISDVQLWWVSMYCFGSITNMYSHNVFSYDSPLPASAPCVWAAVQTKSLGPQSLLCQGTAGLPGNSEGGGCCNRRLYDWATAPQCHRCIWVCLTCPSGTGMYLSGRRQFSTYPVLSIASG